MTTLRPPCAHPRSRWTTANFLTTSARRRCAHRPAARGKSRVAMCLQALIRRSTGLRNAEEILQQADAGASGWTTSAWTALSAAKSMARTLEHDPEQRCLALRRLQAIPRPSPAPHRESRPQRRRQIRVPRGRRAGRVSTAVFAHMTTLTYAGIPADTAAMSVMSAGLARTGWHLAQRRSRTEPTVRSGRADRPASEPWLPWRGYNGHRTGLPRAVSVRALIGVHRRSRGNAMHPAWDRCSQAVRKLHARNAVDPAFGRPA